MLWSPIYRFLGRPVWESAFAPLHLKDGLHWVYKIISHTDGFYRCQLWDRGLGRSKLHIIPDTCFVAWPIQFHTNKDSLLNSLHKSTNSLGPSKMKLHFAATTTPRCSEARGKDVLRYSDTIRYLDNLVSFNRLIFLVESMPEILIISNGHAALS